jgi:KDO2-lipid IV(A) lauroyltransferase
LGRIAFGLFRKSTRVALANLRLVYGDSRSDVDMSRVALRAYENLGRFAFDVVRSSNGGAARIMGPTAIRGLEHLDRALKRGRGVIAITGHVGNWELLGAYLSLSGYKVNVLATALKDARLDRLVNGVRAAAGLAVIERTRGLKRALRCLRRGEVLGILIDLDTSVESVTVDFLGRPAKTAVGPVRLAQQTGAAVVPMAMVLGDNGRYSVEIREPVEVTPGKSDLKANVQRCSRAVEEFIREYPTQWAWMHKRWKSVDTQMYS